MRKKGNRGKQETERLQGFGFVSARKPLERDDPMIAAHRDQGFRECRGELMIFLEIME